jgi:hypothetical protein
MQMIFRIVIILILSSMARAGECQATKWPYSSKIEKLTPQNFKIVKREFLDDYLFYELSSPVKSRVPGLASKILYYLKNTEQNEPKFYFYAALELSADLATNDPKIIPLPQICDLRGAVLRDPSSIKNKPAIKQKFQGQK